MLQMKLRHFRNVRDLFIILNEIRICIMQLQESWPMSRKVKPVTWLINYR